MWKLGKIMFYTQFFLDEPKHSGEQCSRARDIFFVLECNVYCSQSHKSSLLTIPATRLRPLSGYLQAAPPTPLRPPSLTTPGPYTHKLTHRRGKREGGINRRLVFLERIGIGWKLQNLQSPLPQQSIYKESFFF